MKKRILSILLTMCTVLYLVLTAVFADDNAIKEVATADELTSAMADSANAVVKLTENIDIDSTLNTNHDITLDLNGCVLKMTGDDRVIQVNNAFTLTDSSPQTEHRFSQSGIYDRWVLDEVNGDKIVNGGVITGDSVSGGGVIVENGSFTMKGGNIAGCSAKCGGVYAKRSFTMEGGAIVGCKAFNLGGSAYGGVYLTDYSGFTLDGGTITDCIAFGSKDGNGGVYCAKYYSDQHKVSIQSGTIKNCKAFANMNRTYGGGVFIDGTKFEMSGGLIQQCEAEFGGGLCVFGEYSAVFSGAGFLNVRLFHILIQLMAAVSLLQPPRLR